MPITIRDITTGSINGTGDFDVLMQSAKEHLQLEYTSGRITGDKYAEAYIAMMNQVMAQAIAFHLGAVQAEAQIGLTEEQKQLIIAQTAQVKAETLNVPKQGAILDKEVEVKTKQIEQATAQISLTTKQVEQVTAEILNIPKQGKILDQQELSLKAEILNIPKQGEVLDKQVLNLDKDLTLKDKQALQITSAIALSDQKTKTEKAQISDVVDGSVTGVVGKQKEVYTAQIKGFQQDAVNKATKILVDTWSVRASSDQTANPPTAENKLENADIGKFITELGNQVGVMV